MNNLISANASMTSKEIAELVGSREDNVKRTIERLANSGVISQPPTEDGIKSANGVIPKHYVFSGEKGKRDSIIVVAQLYPEFTARLVDRWKELEDERVKPKSQAEIIAAMALANLESERRISHVEQKVEQVNEVVEQIKQGTIPAGWIGYSLARTKSGMTVDKCKTLTKQFNVRKNTITILTPEGMPRPMAIIHEADFISAFKTMMNEAEKRGTRWHHPKMGLFQAIGWEDK
ncbi:TPA: Rha family transcriptional regulator [Proteus mirabilis]|uniref:Rha family transcriptional regulator n=1 Tax=Proteus mirabilis TaxID=584 RepID=UPI002998CD88|nr:Rha family transcriptional regulator [Proteus mirabilis]MDX4950955.1 Rha family transcriptional regulator [Proteus mirabilis]HCQ9180316.1 Rha family transcriptional regulator [Proteus mirabilis]HDA9904624.1 Rha family transcriptional regulator [Proteus mirabilis]HEH4198467.1 Rha family transcriptional regulator [Proteus mirabilis]HEH4213052.1 Rha family transcriptional regulator [Proteus mirabilis]